MDACVAGGAQRRGVGAAVHRARRRPARLAGPRRRPTRALLHLQHVTQESELLVYDGIDSSLLVRLCDFRNQVAVLVLTRD